MLAKGVNQKRLSKIENKAFIFLVVVLLLVSIVLISNIFIRQNVNTPSLETTISFIKQFNFILSVLALASCGVSYSRSKKDNIFIMMLMYLGLSIGIGLGQTDYLTFYSQKLNINSYIVVSTSLLRMGLLLVAVSKSNKWRALILNHKKQSILFVALFTIVIGYLETTFNSHHQYESNICFILYNVFLLVVYVYCSVKLFFLGLKDKDYLFVILSASIFMLAIKAIYAIYGLGGLSELDSVAFYVKLISVSITYLCFLIVICGNFIELFLNMVRVKVLNDNLTLFYNLADNNKHSCMFICDEKLNIVYANKKIKEAYGESDVTVLSHILKDYLVLSSKKESIIKSLRQTGIWRGILNFESGDKTIDCSIQVITDYNDKKEISVTYMDISDEINAELELEKLKVYDKEKSAFITNVSHELNTPLNIFYSVIQLLDSVCDGDDQKFKRFYKKYKVSMGQNCRRMLKLINNMMDISKIETNSLQATFDNYDFISIVNAVGFSSKKSAALKSINIQIRATMLQQVIVCDANLIERLVINLLSNAIKFSTKGKSVAVNVFSTPEWIVLEVSDKGIGISDKDQAIIFERFIQVDKSFTRMNEGIGMGLSIVKAIVSQHDGKIELDSTLNEGSTFRVFLPNKQLEDTECKVYYLNEHNIELELSDIQ